VNSTVWLVAGPVGWLAVALSLALDERRSSNHRAPARVTPAARRSDELMQISTAVALAGPVLLALVAQRPVRPLTSFLALGIAFAGVRLRHRAMRSLAGRYRLTSAAQPDAPALVDRGPYAVIRHPGYAGLVLTFAGLALLAAGPPGLVSVLPMGFAVLVRIRIEENLLREEFPQTHTAYLARVRWRLAPGLY
jgi:protein-S-isoprenylcysteine O-methyltransferase Ste14